MANEAEMLALADELSKRWTYGKLVVLTQFEISEVVKALRAAAATPAEPSARQAFKRLEMAGLNYLPQKHINLVVNELKRAYASKAIKP